MKRREFIAGLGSAAVLAGDIAFFVGGSMKSAIYRLLSALAMTGLSLLMMTSLSVLGTRAADDEQSMPNQQMMTDLFDRRERVWHEGQFDLVPSCVGDHYIRHDDSGDRTVTRDAYAAEIAKARQERPGIRFIVYDHST